MSNYKVLYLLRVFKSILVTFVDSFLVLYFLDVSNSNILPLGIYKLVAVVAIYITIFLCKNYAKTKHRVNLMRIGILLDFIYFMSIILLKEKVIDYIYLIGLIYGLEEGFYFSVYNMIESDGVENEERTKFIGSYTATNSILSIIFPLIFGSLIYETGFIKSLIIVLIIIIIRMILSFLIKDKNIPKGNKTKIKKFLQITKNDKKYKRMYLIELFSGLTYSEGAFSYIVTIYIIKVFSNSLSLGIFTSIFSLITCIIGILFSRFINKKYYSNIIKISMIFTVISLVIMIFNCNFLSIIIFNLFQTISRNIMNLINSNSQANICNDELIKKEYKVEYWLLNETALLIGRVISNLLFILMAFINIDYMILIFVVFLILFALNSMKLQNILKENST